MAVKSSKQQLNGVMIGYESGNDESEKVCIDIYREAEQYLIKKFGLCEMTHAFTNDKAFMYMERYNRDKKDYIVFIHPTMNNPLAYVGKLNDVVGYVNDFNMARHQEGLKVIDAHNIHC